MINVLIIKNKQDIISIEATGHSGYAEEGSDIVCSAVSTLMQNLAIGLTEVVKTSPKVIIDETIPHMYVSVHSDISSEAYTKAQLLMQTTALSLKQVANGYQKFIKIKEKQK